MRQVGMLRKSLKKLNSITSTSKHYKNSRFWISSAPGVIQDVARDQKLTNCFNVLEVTFAENVTPETLKNNYARLAQKYHPDTGKDQANAEKFNEVCAAYKYITKEYLKENEPSTSSSVSEENTGESPDIRHVAPQHRQFLEYDGIGSGTPVERQKFNQQYRFSKAVGDAREYQFEKAMQSAETADALRTLEQSNTFKRVRQTQKMTGMIERVVEDMILSSMATGQFDNLRGQGKPLDDDHTNPYIDETEKRINKILKNNGFTPLWIAREAEVRQMIDELRKELKVEKLKEVIAEKEFPHLSSYDNLQLTTLEDRILKINKAIRDYNLISPTLDRQFLDLSAERELQRARTDALKLYDESNQNNSGEQQFPEIIVELGKIRAKLRKMSAESSSQKHSQENSRSILKSMLANFSRSAL
ncbi:dnaJ domain-containing protein [Ditylenchus destructor]|nr:dnaJ domain-containing protein [Ditylenchus destructor]